MFLRNYAPVRFTFRQNEIRNHSSKMVTFDLYNNIKVRYRPIVGIVDCQMKITMKGSKNETNLWDSVGLSRAGSYSIGPKFSCVMASEFQRMISCIVTSRPSKRFPLEFRCKIGTRVRIHCHFLQVFYTKTPHQQVLSTSNACMMLFLQRLT